MQDAEENTWEPLDNLGEAEKAIKLFEKELELKNLSAVKAQGQQNKRKLTQVGLEQATTSSVCLSSSLLPITNCLLCRVRETSPRPKVLRYIKPL